MGGDYLGEKCFAEPGIEPDDLSFALSLSIFGSRGYTLMFSEKRACFRALS